MGRGSLRRRGGEFAPRAFLSRDPFSQGIFFTGTCNVASETGGDSIMD